MNVFFLRSVTGASSTATARAVLRAGIGLPFRELLRLRRSRNLLSLVPSMVGRLRHTPLFEVHALVCCAADKDAEHTQGDAVLL